MLDSLASFTLISFKPECDWSLQGSHDLHLLLRPEITLWHFSKSISSLGSFEYHMPSPHHFCYLRVAKTGNLHLCGYPRLICRQGGREADQCLWVTKWHAAILLACRQHGNMEAVVAWDPETSWSDIRRVTHGLIWLWWITALHQVNASKFPRYYQH